MKVKKILRVIGLFFIIGLIGLSTLWSSVEASQKKKIVWKFSQMTSGKNCDPKLFGEWLPKRLAEATNGQLELHSPLGLVNPAEALHAVRDGIVTGAMNASPYFAGEWALGAFQGVPGILMADDEFEAVGNAVVWDYWERSLRKKYNIRLLGLYDWPGIHLYCNKPIRTIEDFKGKKLRGMGYYDSLAFVKIGAKGVSIPWSEAFLAMQRGVADGMVTGLVAYETIGFWNYCKYIHKWPLHGSSCAAFIIVNGDAFDSLPEEIKPAVTRIFKEAGERVSRCNRTLVEASMKRLKEKGCEVIKQSDKQVQECLEITRTVRDTWLEQCEQTGSPEAKEMFDKMEAFLSNYRANK
jgi:TRAP-type C4-dicarboxylate transport system substrate-binding protein